eukprot:261712-Alexandrium_andersonii.AAC.1
MVRQALRSARPALRPGLTCINSFRNAKPPSRIATSRRLNRGSALRRAAVERTPFGAGPWQLSR